MSRALLPALIGIMQPLSPISPPLPSTTPPTRVCVISRSTWRKRSFPPVESLQWKKRWSHTVQPGLHTGRQSYLTNIVFPSPTPHSHHRHEADLLETKTHWFTGITICHCFYSGRARETTFSGIMLWLGRKMSPRWQAVIITNCGDYCWRLHDTQRVSAQCPGVEEISEWVCHHTRLWHAARKLRDPKTSPYWLDVRPWHGAVVTLCESQHCFIRCKGATDLVYSLSIVHTVCTVDTICPCYWG